MTVAVTGLDIADAENFKNIVNEKIKMRSMNSSFDDGEPIMITGNDSPTYEGGECTSCSPGGVGSAGGLGERGGGDCKL